MQKISKIDHYKMSAMKEKNKNKHEESLELKQLKFGKGLDWTQVEEINIPQG